MLTKRQPHVALSFSGAVFALIDGIVVSALCTAVNMKETIIPMLYLDRVITYRTKESFVVKRVPWASCVAQQV